MHGRALVAALALSALTFTAACSSSSPAARSTNVSPTPQVLTTASSSTPAPTRSPAATAPRLTAPAAAATSPALAKYGKTKVTQALDLAAHLAYYSVADPKLLGRTAPHTTLADYSNITRYLTPQGISYLHGYIRNQDSSAKDGVIAAELALALRPLPRGSNNASKATDHTTFDTPFRPRNYRAAISPTVRIGQNGVTMIVNGSCSVQVPGTHNGKAVLVTLTRTYFTYYIQPQASQAYPEVGVYGWASHSTLTFAAA